MILQLLVARTLLVIAPGITTRNKKLLTRTVWKRYGLVRQAKLWAATPVEAMLRMIALIESLAAATFKKHSVLLPQTSFGTKGFQRNIQYMKIHVRMFFKLLSSATKVFERNLSCSLQLQCLSIRPV